MCRHFKAASELRSEKNCLGYFRKNQAKNVSQHWQKVYRRFKAASKLASRRWTGVGNPSVLSVQLSLRQSLLRQCFFNTVLAALLLDRVSRVLGTAPSFSHSLILTMTNKGCYWQRQGGNGNGPETVVMQHHTQSHTLSFSSPTVV